MKTINLTLIQPFGYTHSLGLVDILEYCYSKLLDLGFNVTVSKNEFNVRSTNVVFGLHIDPDKYRLPNKTIIFNTEQFCAENNWTSNIRYVELIKNHHVWDYSERNIGKIKDCNFTIIPIGYQSSLIRIPKEREYKYDLIFYGSLNVRREIIINRLRDRGLNVHVLFNVYGKELDKHIQKSRAVLNLHYYESMVFQKIRAFYPLINSVPVISEDSIDDDDMDSYSRFIFRPNGSCIVQYITDLFEDINDFDKVAKIKLEQFKSRTIKFNVVKDVLEKQFFNKKEFQMEYIDSYKTLNILSKADHKIDSLNISSGNCTGGDIIIDLSEPFEKYDPSFNVNEFMRFQKFEKIYANKYLCESDNLDIFFLNCLWLLKINGTLHFSVPYQYSAETCEISSTGKQFNEYSWESLTTNFWVSGYFNYRFELIKSDLILTEIGQRLKSTNHSNQDIFSTPRAVGGMDVVLKKILTTDHEQSIAATYGSVVPLSERYYQFP